MESSLAYDMREAESAASELPRAKPDPARARQLVTENVAFVWRSLVRFGVPRPDADDALQHVFLVASRKIDDILPGRERAFLLAIALRVASRTRRAHDRRREVLDGEHREQLDAAPGPDELLDKARARRQLDAVLDEMPLDLRSVFVLFELEQSTMAEIAELLDLAPGTVASRLRRAREHFQSAMHRTRLRAGRGGT